MRIFKLQVLHWDQIIYGILILEANCKDATQKKPNCKLKFHLRKLAGGRFEFTTGHRDEPTCPSSLFHPPSNFSYEMWRTWATVQIASQDFFVQTGGVVPPILYLESFCS